MRPITPLLAAAATALLLLGGTACDSDAGDDPGAGDTGVLADGTYFIAVGLEPLGGLQVFFRAQIEADTDALTRFTLSAVSADKTFESATPIAEKNDVAVGSDGAFVLDLGDVVVPGEATPTGTEVTIEGLILTGNVTSPTTLCGSVQGYLPLLTASIDGSTFGGVTNGTETSPPLAGCEATVFKPFDPIGTCPTLTEGTNTLKSAEIDRTFLLYTPVDPGAEALPIVFLFHGLGGDPASIVDPTGWDQLVDTEKIILVVPSAAKDSAGESIKPTDWAFLDPNFGRDNIDIVFVDDLITCVSEQHTVDPKRLYVTGMSGGGLASTFLGINMADRIAAAAPLSGGYNHAFPSDIRKVPFLVTWGGVDDVAVGTDFDAQSKRLIGDLDINGHDAIRCNHGADHSIPPEMTVPIWEWMNTITLDDNGPGYTTLPVSFPSYCTLEGIPADPSP
ncbi:MAG: putative esterase [Myxococcota bacterium]|jgi:predicted esterase